MGGGEFLAPQQVIIQAVKESSIWVKIWIALIPVVGGLILAWYKKKKTKK